MTTFELVEKEKKNNYGKKTSKNVLRITELEAEEGIL